MTNISGVSNSTPNVSEAKGLTHSFGVLRSLLDAPDSSPETDHFLVGSCFKVKHFHLFRIFQYQSAGPCVQQSTPAHGEQGSTQQSTTERRQSSEVAGCRLPCIYWKTLTAGRANVGHKQIETRHRGGCFRQATHKENNLVEETAAGCRLKAQVLQALRSPKRCVCPLLLSHWHLMMLVRNQPSLPPDSFLSTANDY